MNGQPVTVSTATPITLAQWVPTLLRWYPLRHGVVVGASQQAIQLLNAKPEKLTLFKANTSQTKPHPPEANVFDWLIADQNGPTNYYQASLACESGLLDPQLLKTCWPGIRCVTRQQVEARTLDAAWAHIKADQIETQDPNWLWVGSMPSAPVLAGAAHLLQEVDAVAVRVTLQPEASTSTGLDSVQDLLFRQGLMLCGIEPERNPKLGTAIFVRDYAEATARALRQLEERGKEYVQQLSQATVELHASKNQIAALELKIQVEVEACAQKLEEAKNKIEKLSKTNDQILRADAQLELIKKLIIVEQGKKLQGLEQQAIEAEIKLESDSFAVNNEFICMPVSDYSLLDKTSIQWQFGDWSNLINLDIEYLDQHPERVELALLVSAGHHQSGDLKKARECIHQAQIWGCDNYSIVKYLVLGVYNNLAKIAAMMGQTERANHYLDNIVKSSKAFSDQTVKSSYNLFLKKKFNENGNLEINKKTKFNFIKKIAFMHIAKTAGSSVVDYFRKVYGESSCHPFCENEINNGSSLYEISRHKKFISGHFFYGHIAELPKEEFIKFTIFREPYSHFASHLQWLDHYNSDGLKHDFDRLDQNLKSLISEIKYTDIYDVWSLSKFIKNISTYGVYYLNNLQTRYLIGDWSFMSRINLEDAYFAENSLNGFDYIGDEENLEAVVQSVCQSAGLPLNKWENINIDRKNVATGGRRIDISNPNILEIISEFVQSDNYIFNKIKSRVNYPLNK